MDDEDRSRPGGGSSDYGAASQLTGESLDSYSRDELDARIALLEAEIARVREHRSRSAAHRLAADSLFNARPAGTTTP